MTTIVPGTGTGTGTGTVPFITTYADGDHNVPIASETAAHMALTSTPRLEPASSTQTLDANKIPVTTTAIDAAKKSAGAEASVTDMVDITKHPYNKRFIIQNMTSEAKNRGFKEAGYLLEKDFATDLLRAATKNDLTLVIESALRTKGNTTSSGTSHNTGQAVDIVSYITGAEKKAGLTEALLSNKSTRRRYDLAGMLKSSGFNIAHGSDLYPKIADQELTHYESAYNVSQKATAEQREAARNSVIKAQAAFKEAMEKYNGNRASLRPLGVSILPDGSPKVLYNQADIQRSTYEESSPNTFSIPKEDLINAKVSKQVSTGKSPSNAGLTQGALGSSNNGRSPEDYAYKTFSPEKIALRDLRPGADTRPTAVSITEARLGRWNDMARMQLSDMQATRYIGNKILKNVYSENKNPHGQLNKHDGPPASIKIVMDELYRDKLTPSAAKAWAALEKASLTYIDCFFLERTQVAQEERYQLVQSISDEYKVYFSGKRPTVMGVNGRLLNTYNQQWLYDFEFFYENYLRGSKAVENKLRAFLTIADKIYEVLMLKFGFSSDSVFDNAPTFSMEYIVIQTVYTGEYQTPVNRNLVDTNTSPDFISNTQTDYSDKTRQVINNSKQSAASNNASASAHRGTSVQVNAVDPGAVRDGYASGKNKFNINNPREQTPRQTSKSRDSLHTTPNARAQQDQLLARTSVQNVDINKLSSNKLSNNKGAGDVSTALDKGMQKLSDFRGDFERGLDNKYPGSILNPSNLKELGDKPDGEIAGTLVNAYNSAITAAGTHTLASDVQQAFTGKPLPGSEVSKKIANLKPVDTKNLNREIIKIENIVREAAPVLKQIFAQFQQLGGSANR